MPKRIIFSLVLIFSLVFTACAKEPVVAFFTDGTSAGSDNYTVNIDFVTDKRFDEKYIDILILSTVDDLEITFKREFDTDTEFLLQEKEVWYSITKLLNDNDAERNEEFRKFSEKSDMTLVIKSQQKTIVKLKATVGDKQENSEGEIVLINQVDISNEFSLELGRNSD